MGPAAAAAAEPSAVRIPARLSAAAVTNSGVATKNDIAQPLASMQSYSRRNAEETEPNGARSKRAGNCTFSERFLGTLSPRPADAAATDGIVERD